MENLIDNLILSNSSNLLISDGVALREVVKKLEERCRLESNHQDEDDSIRHLWLKLIETSLNNQNIKLAFLIIAKLKLTQLALILKSTLNTNQDEIAQLFTFIYIAHYFHLPEQVSRFFDLLREAQQKIDTDLLDLNELSSFYVNSGLWDEAFRWFEIKSLDDNEELLNQRVLSYKLALQSEFNEEFSESLVYYEKSTTSEFNSPRVIIKQSNKSAYSELRNYCLTKSFMRDFFVNYSSNCDILDDLQGYDEVVNTLPFNIMSTRSRPEEVEKIILHSLPKQMREFVLDISFEKWLNKQKLESMLSMGASLSSSSSRVQIATLANYYQKVSCVRKASSIYLLLNQQEVTSSLMAQDLDSCSAMHLHTQFTTPAKLCAETIDFLNSRELKSKSRDTYSKSKTSRILFDTCLKLGLINEALIAFVLDPHKDEKVLSPAINLIEGSIEKKYSGTLDNIDPTLPNETFELLSILLEEVDKIIATRVITLIILCVVLTLHKFNTKIPYQVDIFIEKLEIMFLNLSKCFESSNFHASTGLTRVMKNLIDIVTDKLEALSDSDIIRGSFKKIVESTASRCMIESQYKNAAMLYSKLEDNVSAVKSLMRLGEIDIVVDYSLLVRDLKVNRITINYLKHLEVDSSIIEDFITRSKAS